MGWQAISKINLNDKCEGKNKVWKWAYEVGESTEILGKMAKEGLMQVTFEQKREVKVWEKCYIPKIEREGN